MTASNLPAASDCPAANAARPDQRVRVLFLNTRSALGADVAVHLSLIQNLDPQLVDVFVATNCNSVDLDITLDVLKTLPQERVLVADLGHEVAVPNSGIRGRIKGFFRNLPALVTLVRLTGFMRRQRIDLLHSTDRPRDALFSTLLAKLTGRRNLLHVHISWNEHFGKATRWALHRCSAVLAISEFTRESFERAGIPRAKLYMSHNATDTTRFDPARVPAGRLRGPLGLAPETPLIGIVARVMVWKGHSELIDALAKVRDAIPIVQLAIVGKEDLLASQGDGGFARHLKARIEALGLAPNVHWVGWSDDIPGVMRDLDVLAMPSWEEPFGLAVTEALAMQTPVVGFASGALPEIITHGEEGLLVPARDTDALASALIRLLGDSDLRAAMGQKGRERVLRAFSPGRQADEVAAIYRAIGQKSF